MRQDHVLIAIASVELFSPADRTVRDLLVFWIFLWKNMTALFRTLEVHLVTWNTIDSPVDDLTIERVLSPSGLDSSSSLASWGRDWYGREIFLSWGTADCWTPQRASRAGFPCRGGSAFWVCRVGFNFANGRYHQLAGSSAKWIHDGHFRQFWVI